MKLSDNVLVASRYQLVSCLGAGAMGEVWRAQDTRFETRTVAVKFLREDETLKEDQLNRDRLTIRLEQHAARGTLSFETALGSVVAALGTANPEGVRTKLTSAIGHVSAITPAAVVGVFDELVNDPTLNDNARMRAKLRRLFRDEANAVANLRHDNIVSIFDYGDHEGSPYLVMDYIEGRTLYQVIQERQKLANSRRLLLIEDLCAGLGYAHRHKLVHRDIKPANLIIDGSTGSLKILDFGVVRRLGSASTVGVPVGTFCYMSPEQTKGAATLDHRSDIFAVGLVFYELMVGKKAYPPGKSIGDLVARIQRDPPPEMLKLDPTIPTPVQDIIDKAIQKLPDNRYPDLSIMERDIRRLRMRLQAEEQQEGTSSVTITDDQTIIKPRQAAPTPAQLLVSAQTAFNGGDDKAAGDLARQVLALAPDDTAALSLLDRINARTIEARVRDMLQPAEKFLADDELTSARGALAAAESVNPSSPTIAAFRAKLDDAVRNRAATLDRLQRERERNEQDQRGQQERAREQERLEREQRLQEERAREQARLDRERRARDERANEQARLAAEQRAREEQERVAREQKAREEREHQEREQREREEKAREQERLAREQKAREERERQEREQREREEKAREQERLAREQKTREERERQERELSAQRERARQERERQEAEQRTRAQQEREQRERAEVEQRQQEQLRQQRLRELARADSSGDLPTDVTVQLSHEALRAPLTTPPALSKSRVPASTPVSRKPGPIPGQPPAVAPAPPLPAAPPAPPPAVPPPTSGPKTARPSGKSKRYTAKPGPAKSGIPGDTPATTPSAPQSSGSRPAAGAITTPPLATARQGVSPSTLAIATAILVLVLAAIAVLVWVRSGGGEPPVQPAPQTPQAVTPPPETAPPATNISSVEPSPPPVAEEPPPIETPAPATMSTVYIDLRPWARVKIIPATPDPAIPTDTFFAPFAIDLPPGDYNLEAENGGVNRATTFQLKVAAGGAQSFVRNMPGFNATKVVEGLLGQD